MSSMTRLGQALDEVRDARFPELWTHALLDAWLRGIFRK